ncbi:MAG TPA: zinc-binding dehydrogenase [Actinomycetota bacterium]|nr:zinc-binding dehydrogenase [Actinomycetota bacterium]
MKAIVAVPSAAGGSEIREIAEPDPISDQAVVDVRAVSLNRGECTALRSAEEGWRPGWDVAGVITRPAADGSGPREGARVTGWVNGGGWAERSAVRTDHLAEIPDELPIEVASTLPVAGLTAVGLLGVRGTLLGKRVAITGAAGGVGRFVIQLAHMAGAHVTAIVGRPERAEGLAGLGADEIAVGLAPEGDPFDLILESVGGASLAAAVDRIAPEGTIVTFGNSSNEPTAFDTRVLYRKGAPTMLGFFVTYELLHGRTGSSRLAALATLVAEGRLSSKVDLTLPWERAAEAIDALMERRISGKAVLTIGPTGR